MEGTEMAARKPRPRGPLSEHELQEQTIRTVRDLLYLHRMTQRELARRMSEEYGCLITETTLSNRLSQNPNTKDRPAFSQYEVYAMSGIFGEPVAKFYSPTRLGRPELEVVTDDGRIMGGYYRPSGVASGQPKPLEVTA